MCWCGSFGDGFVREAVDELWEGWMRHADAILADEQLLEIVHQALQRRRPRSRTHGRPGTPAEVVLRLLLLKHMRNWSFAVFVYLFPEFFARLEMCGIFRIGN